VGYITLRLNFGFDPLFCRIDLSVLKFGNFGHSMIFLTKKGDGKYFF